MYRVSGISRYVGSCMQHDHEKTFIIRFFAKLYYSKLCRECDYAMFEEKFGYEWVKVTSYVGRRVGYAGSNVGATKAM